MLILFIYVGRPILIMGGNFLLLGDPRTYKVEKPRCEHLPFCFWTVDATSCFKLLGFLHLMTCSLNCE